jgi:hypothetical protein
LDEADKVIPRAWSIGHILRRLGFKLRKRNGNRTYLTLDGFKLAYRTIKQKYGEPEPGESCAFDEGEVTLDRNKHSLDIFGDCQPIPDDS